MTFTLDISLALGPGKSGLSDLQAQLISSSGSNVGGLVTSGFLAVGAGNYLWHYEGFPDGHRGGVKVNSAASSGEILAFFAVNPEDRPQTVLTYDFSGAPNVSGQRNLLNASRKLINKWDSATSGYLTFYREDDATVAFRQKVSIASGTAPVTGLDTD